MIALEFHPGPDGSPAWFRLEQRDSRGSMREVLWRPERVDVRHDDRPWSHHAPDGELFERWLDDAYRCVGESVQLAGAGLSVRVSPEAAGLDTRRLMLGLHDDRPSAMLAVTSTDARGQDAPTSPTPVPSPVDAWREGTIVTGVDGEVELTADGPPWSRARVDVAWRSHQRDERGATRGRLTLTATLDAIDARSAPPPPSESMPLPLRRRLTQEAEELLDGLAGR